MGISDLIASFLQESLEETDGGVLEVQRNDLAQRFNCVPSQINYVMSTRFPRSGVISWRAAGAAMATSGSPGPGRPPDAADAGHQHPGSQVDLASARAILNNLVQAGAWRRTQVGAFWPPSATRPWPRSRGRAGTPSGRTS